ncbi:ComF family protein [Phocaeicola sp.]|uniref:ComF family protein n=1 Tax=Phocaeicola sp. TaxID=2773926 RepID=UPI00386EF365
MSFWTDWKDFFFPRFCVTCGRPLLAGEKALCVSCISGLPYTGLGNTSGNEMERCFWGRFPVERATSLFFYKKDGHVAQILYGMKYKGRKKLCLQMGRLIAEELKPAGFFDGVDYLLPVPLHPSRKKRRGYNQSELLAQGISMYTHIPLCAEAVCRIHNNESQTHKSGFERWQNVSQLFRATGAAQSLSHTHVMIVDDVLTTGATLISCADALAQVEGIRISVVTLAWAK